MFSFVWIYFWNIHQTSAILCLNGYYHSVLIYFIFGIEYNSLISTYYISHQMTCSLNTGIGNRPLKNAYWLTTNQP